MKVIARFAHALAPLVLGWFIAAPSGAQSLSQPSPAQQPIARDAGTAPASIQLDPLMTRPLLLREPALRISVELLAGAAVETASIALGIGVFSALDDDDCKSVEEECLESVGELTARWAIGYGVGSAVAGFAVPATIWGIGEASGRSGSYWAGFAGHAAGWLANLGLSYAFNELNDGTLGAVLIVTSTILLPAIGTVVGYELSASDAAEYQMPSVVPVAAVSADGSGGMVGLAGRF